MRPIILMFGPPCSGKSAVGEKLAAHLGFEHVVTSDLLRRYRGDTADTMNAGSLVADDIMISVLERHLARSGGFVIDSLRSPSQVRWIKRAFPVARTLSFHFQVCEEQIRKRLEAASRTERGARSDDASLTRRLEEYQVYCPETEPYLRGMTLYEKVDANKSFEEVSSKVFEISDSWGLNKAQMLAEAEAS